MSKLLEAVKEASISVACLLDDVAVKNNKELNLTELQKDIEHLQDLITIIENYLDPFVIEELDTIKKKEMGKWVRATGFTRTEYEWEGEIPSDVPEKDWSVWVRKNADWQECQEQIHNYTFIADEDITVDIYER